PSEKLEAPAAEPEAPEPAAAALEVEAPEIEAPTLAEPAPVQHEEPPAAAARWSPAPDVTLRGRTPTAAPAPRVQPAPTIARAPRPAPAPAPFRQRLSARVKFDIALVALV